MTTCSFTTCAADATSEILMIPRRTDSPISQKIARALAWPDVELATTIATCAAHRAAFRATARKIMAEIALGDDVVARKVVD